ncbi:hypothetical protein HAX54_034468, partial [Datura stramonium]|nr:hypothetical protein [Datura stramonium]
MGDSWYEEHPGGLSSSKRGKLLEIGFDNMTNPVWGTRSRRCILNRKVNTLTGDK